MDVPPPTTAMRVTSPPLPAYLFPLPANVSFSGKTLAVAPASFALTSVGLSDAVLAAGLVRYAALLFPYASDAPPPAGAIVRAMVNVTTPDVTLRLGIDESLQMLIVSSAGKCACGATRRRWTLATSLSLQHRTCMAWPRCCGRRRRTRAALPPTPRVSACTTTAVGWAHGACRVIRSIFTVRRRVPSSSTQRGCRRRLRA